MHDLMSWYRSRVSTRITALEKARWSLDENPMESIESIRRIAHALRGSATTCGFPEIVTSARHVEEASPGELPERMEELLSALRRASEGRRPHRTGILIIEDDEDTACLLKGLLERPDRDLHVARSAAEAEVILSEREVSLILLDLVLPDTDGRNLLVKLRERVSMATVPVIVVTVKGSAQVRAECLALGADGFMVKPVDPEILKDRVAECLRQESEVTSELRIDALTGLPNRAAFLEHFRRARCSSVETREPLSLALLNFDRFSAVNDRHGRKLGDQLLRRAMAVISRTLRSSDLLARWANEEFVALLPRTDRDGAVRGLQKALAALRCAEFPTGDGRSVQLTFSGGIVQIREDMTLEDAMAEADRHLHFAKEAGRNRVLSDGPSAPVSRKRILLAEDDELIRRMTKQLLEAEGYEVVAHGDGEAALAAARRMPVSMVITDVQMPRMDGFELVRRLRGLASFAKVPIVMVTSMGSEEDIVRGFEIGADDYMLKPFSSRELIARTRRLLRYL